MHNIRRWLRLRSSDVPLPHNHSHIGGAHDRLAEIVYAMVGVRSTKEVVFLCFGIPMLGFVVVWSEGFADHVLQHKSAFVAGMEWEMNYQTVELMKNIKTTDIRARFLNYRPSFVGQLGGLIRV
jgi:hypothetical protein